MLSAGVDLSSCSSRGLASDSQNGLLECSGLVLGQGCIRDGWYWWEHGSSICGGGGLKLSRWSWAWVGGGQRASGGLCCGTEVVFNVTGEVEREQVAIAVRPWDGDLQWDACGYCGVWRVT